MKMGPPRMERMGAGLLVTLVLGMNCWSCAGFPVYDYDPASLRDALGASVAKVNSQSLSPFLLRPFRSSLKRVNLMDEGSLSLDLEFSVRETTCRKDSREDPATCNFQRGYHVPAAQCRSTVQVSAEQVQDVWVRCRWSFSSESNSSEERVFAYALRPYKWRNNYQIDLTPDNFRRQQFYDRSHEAMRTVPLPGNRNFRSQWYRGGINSGEE
ncbi:secreted phosphoprotein 24 isoform X1 [Erinaceus europaeus]|uniref:Secreted phosphoprotein 24 n=1 Tax=Erinaceus europaeus TaxID=9365 RepID=A0A1S3W712_ERIEU|nr:secreted phosphoprotein 24 isoform X1 [Erinaceus europaeus]